MAFTSAATTETWSLGYDANTNLQSITDPNSHAWSFAYDTAQPTPYMHDLTALTDPDTHTTTIKYNTSNPAGTVASITDATGANTTTYSGYCNNTSCSPANGASYATEVTYPDGGIEYYNYTDLQLYLLDIGYGTAYQATYRYQSNGSATSPAETTTDPNGNETIVNTDEVGNVLSETDYAGPLNLTSYGTTTTAYNSFDEPCWVALPGVTVPANPSCTNAPAAGSGATFYSYDTYGDLTEKVDPVGNFTNYGYDTNGDPCWQTLPDTLISSPTCSSPPTASTRFTYNSEDELLSESTPDGTSSNYTYDTTTYTYNPYGEMATEVTPDGNVAGGTPANYTTTMNYDAAGRLYQVIAPLSRTTTAQLDAAGNITSVTDPFGLVTSAAYDQDNRICWQYQGTSTSTLCSSPPSGSTVTTYHADTSDPLTITDPNGKTTTYTYVNSAYPDQATTVTDALGNITSNVYDHDGNECVTGASSTAIYVGTTAPLCADDSGYTYNTFDQLGNVLSSTDPLGHTTTYARADDAYPNDVTTVTPPLLGITEGATTYSYDADGRVQSETEGSGSTITTTYTGSGQICWRAPIVITNPNCSTYPTAAGSTIWYYFNSQLPSAIGDIVSTGPAYSYWTYDAQGQLLTNTQETTLAVSYAYDYAGDNTCVAYPVKSGSTCASAPSSTNTVVDYGYDADGRMNSLTDWLGHSFSFSYDSHSNLKSITYPSASTWTQTLGYGAANNLISDTTASPTYGTYTATFTPNADELFASIGSLSYGYNAKLQLTTGGNDTYTYATNGELTGDTPVGKSYETFSYNADSQLTSLVNPNTSTTDYYSYNANGDRCVVSTVALPSCASTTGSTEYAWNAYNQLCSVVVGATATCGSTTGTTFTYDGTGLRTAEKNNGVSEPFVYDTVTRSGQPLDVDDGNNAYIYGPAGFGDGTAPVEQIAISTSTPSYLFSDPTGVRSLVTSTGASSESLSYSAYGLRSTSGSGSTPFGFQGGYTDPTTGLIYLVNRYYDPSTDQFLSVDPDVAETGQPYAFTGDDPLNATDPLGLCWSPIGCGALKRATKDVRSGFHKVVHYADDTRHFVATHRTEIATGAAFLSLAIPGVGEAVGLSDLAISTVAATADATAAAAGTAASVGDARSGNWTGFALDTASVLTLGASRVLGGVAELQDARAVENFSSPAAPLLRSEATFNQSLAGTLARASAYGSAAGFGVSSLWHP